MEILLLETVKNLGNMGEKIKVKSGYARNFLFPQKKAIIANKKNIKIFEDRKIQFQIKLSKELKNAKKLKTKIKELNSLTFFCKIGNNNKLFGSISKKHIVNQLQELKILISKNQVCFPNGIIKSEGIHEIYIKIYKNISEKLFIHIKNNKLKN